MMDTEKIKISKIEYKNRIYELNIELEILMEYTEDRTGKWLCSCVNDWICLSGFSEKKEDALNNLYDDFDYIYREIAEEKDEKLDAMARNLKSILLTVTTVKKI